MAIGSRGDVQPLVALGARLKDRGYGVRLVAGDEFGELASAAGLDFTGLGIAIRSAMQAHTDLFRFAHSITERVLQACGNKQDAIISTFLGVATCVRANEQGIPFFYVLPMPSLSTQAFPNPIFPPLPFGPVYNRWTYRLSDRLAVQAYEPAQSLFGDPRPTYLFCYSNQVVPRPSDWGDYAHVAGYWFLDSPPGWQPPHELAAFLANGTPPVGVTFGSMCTKNVAQTTDQVLSALQQSGRRGVLVAGWGGLKPQDLPANVFVVDSVPFDWLCPRLSMLVHHGGAGTTAEALRAGIPSVIVPFGMDQPFWGRQMQRLGVAPAPVPLKRLTAGRLSQAINLATTDERIKAKAASLGEKIRAEDGTGNAVGIVERVCRQWQR